MGVVSALTFKIGMRRKHSIVKAKMVKFKYAEAKNIDNIFSFETFVFKLDVLDGIDTYKIF